MSNDKKKGAMVKNDAADLTIEPMAAPPEGFERSVRGAGFVGYARAAEGDLIYGVLRGPAPEAVLEKSMSKYGVAIVELLHDCIVSATASQLEGREMDRWTPGPKNRNGQDTFLSKARVGELVAVSIREGIKDEMMMPEGTRVWLKVGKQRPIPGSTNTMYDYEKYTQAPAGGSSKAQKPMANAVPFD